MFGFRPFVSRVGGVQCRRRPRTTAAADRELRLTPGPALQPVVFLCLPRNPIRERAAGKGVGIEHVRAAAAQRCFPDPLKLAAIKRVHGHEQRLVWFGGISLMKLHWSQPGRTTIRQLQLRGLM